MGQEGGSDNEKRRRTSFLRRKSNLILVEGQLWKVIIFIFTEFSHLASQFMHPDVKGGARLHMTGTTVTKKYFKRKS